MHIELLEPLFIFPRGIPHTIVVDGHSGYSTLQALRWLSRNNVPVFILDNDGSLIISILPPSLVKADPRAAQINASDYGKIKFAIARSIV